MFFTLLFVQFNQCINKTLIPCSNFREIKKKVNWESFFLNCTNYVCGTQKVDNDFSVRWFVDLLFSIEQFRFSIVLRVSAVSQKQSVRWHCIVLTPSTDAKSPGSRGRTCVTQQLLSKPTIFFFFWWNCWHQQVPVATRFLIKLIND